MLPRAVREFLSLEEGSLLDSKRFVRHVGFDTARRCKCHRVATDRSLRGAPHFYGLSDKVAGGSGSVADHDALSVDVAFDLAVDADFSLGVEIAGDD